MRHSVYFEKAYQRLGKDSQAYTNIRCVKFQQDKYKMLCGGETMKQGQLTLGVKERRKKKEKTESLHYRAQSGGKKNRGGDHGEAAE